MATTSLPPRTGVGIEDHDLERNFEPFYGNKEMGRGGNGLGPSIVYGVVKDHGGHVDARSKIGGGNEFTVRLSVYL